MKQALLLIFAISFALRIAFNFLDPHVNTAFACDAAEYLRHAQSLNLVLQELFQHPQYIYLGSKVLCNLASQNEIAAIRQLFAPLQGLSISGPAFPLFLLFSYKIFNQAPSLQFSAIPLFTQCILSALTCVLIASIGSSCWNKKVGIIAGLLASTYPGFIINSGRLYSESFATFLICLVLWIICHYLLSNKHNYRWAILLGLTLFSLQVTRSIMSILSLSIFAFLLISCFLVKEKRHVIFKYLSTAFLTFFCCFLPWLALQKLTFGQASLVVDRCGNYNLSVGNNVNTLGWLSIPYPDFSNLKEESFSTIIQNSIAKSPERWFKLVLDKPIRLLKLPWNDFKASIGALSPELQTIFHQLILLLACLGIISLPVVKFKQPKLLGQLIILAVCLLHSVYLAFITLPRYALTAMPEIILFAAAGLTVLFAAFKSKQSFSLAVKLIFSLLILLLLARINILDFLLDKNNSDYMYTKIIIATSTLLKALLITAFFYLSWRFTSQAFPYKNKSVLAITIILALFVIPEYALPLRAHGRWYEWKQELNYEKAEVEKTISFRDTEYQNLQNKDAYLVINLKNGNNIAEDCAILVNDIPLAGPYIPALSMGQDLSLVKTNYSTKGSVKEWSIEQESIFKTLCDLYPTSLVDLRQWFYIPIDQKKWQEILSHAQIHNQNHQLKIVIQKRNKNSNTIYGAYRENKSFSIIPSLSHFSWEKAFYAAEQEDNLNDPFYDEKIISSPGAFINLLILPAEAAAHPRLIAQCANQKASFNHDNLQINFKPTPPINLANTYCLIRIYGQIHTNDQQNKIIPYLKINFTNNDFYMPPWLPTYINASAKNITKFDFAFLIQPNAFPGQPNLLELHLNNNQIVQRPVTDKALGREDCLSSLELYQIPRPLPGPIYEIF